MAIGRLETEILAIYWTLLSFFPKLMKYLESQELADDELKLGGEQREGISGRGEVDSSAFGLK